MNEASVSSWLWLKQGDVDHSVEDLKHITDLVCNSGPCQLTAATHSNTTQTKNLRQFTKKLETRDGPG